MKSIVLAGLVIASTVGFTQGAFASSGSSYGGGRTFVFSPRNHTWSAYENGHLVKSGIASGGKPNHHTPTGTFSVESKGSSGCRSHIYPKPNGGAWMGYCMFFTSKHAIHASDEVPSGYNASHGCIRVQPWAAEWLNHNFLRVGDRVVVTSY